MSVHMCAYGCRSVWGCVEGVRGVWGYLGDSDTVYLGGGDDKVDGHTPWITARIVRGEGMCMCMWMSDGSMRW